MEKHIIKSIRMDESLETKINVWLEGNQHMNFSQLVRRATLKYLILEERR